MGGCASPALLFLWLFSTGIAFAGPAPRTAPPGLGTETNMIKTGLAFGIFSPESVNVDAFDYKLISLWFVESLFSLKPLFSSFIGEEKCTSFVFHAVN